MTTTTTDERLTAAVIRALFPDPVAATSDNVDDPDAYCLGGALTRAHEARHDACVTAETLDDAYARFPAEIAGILEAENPALGGILPAWEEGNTSMGVVYESAIMGANDFDTIRFLDGSTVVIPDHTGLGWQLLEDALTFDPARHEADVAAQVRLLTGCLLAISPDPTYFEHAAYPELWAYFTRHADRYRELTRG